MKKKHSRKLLILLLVLLMVAVGCKTENASPTSNPSLEETEMTGQWRIDFPITEEEHLDPDSMTEYSIQELRDFFGEQPYVYYQVLKNNEDPIGDKHRAVYYVNEHFPVENMRYHTHFLKDGETEYSWEYYYTLYKVKEGGYYRVKWIALGFMLYSRGGVYTKSNLTENDFEGVSVGMLPKYVFEIDPYLIYIPSQNYAWSHSILEDGTVMYITYTYDSSTEEIVEEREEGESWLLYTAYVETKTVENIEDMYGYELGQMLPQDIELCFGK